MKHLLFFILTLFALQLNAQRYPDEFPIDTSFSDDEYFYTQEKIAGQRVARKISGLTIKNYIIGTGINELTTRNEVGDSTAAAVTRAVDLAAERDDSLFIVTDGSQLPNPANLQNNDLVINDAKDTLWINQGGTLQAVGIGGGSENVTVRQGNIADTLTASNEVIPRDIRDALPNLQNRRDTTSIYYNPLTNQFEAYDKNSGFVVPLKREIYANDFGFHSDSSAEANHVALQRAIDFHTSTGTPSIIHIEEGTYRVGSSAADDVDGEIWNIEQTEGLTIRGAGMNKTTIIGERDHIAAATVENYFRLRNAPDITFEDFTLQGEFEISDTMRVGDPRNSRDSSMVIGIVTVAKSSGGNNRNCDNLTVRRVGFKNHYGIQVYDNDATTGFRMEDCLVEDIIFDTDAGGPQPTGVLVNNSSNFYIINNDFFNISSQSDNLAHCVYVGSNCNNGKIIGNTAINNKPSYITWVAGESGSNGLKFGSGLNTNMEVASNYIENGGNYIQDLEQSKIYDNQFVDCQTELLNGCKNIKFYNNSLQRLKDNSVYDGLLEIGSGVVENVEIYTNTFFASDTLTSGIYRIGISSQGGRLINSVIRDNTFKNTGRAIWSGRNDANGIDTTVIARNRFEMMTDGNEFFFVNKGVKNTIKDNVLIQGDFATPRIYRDTDDGDPNNELGNVLIDNKLIGDYNDPYGLVTNATVYIDDVDSTRRNVGIRNALPYSIYTNNLERIRVLGDGTIGINNSGALTGMMHLGTTSNRGSIWIAATSSSSRGIYLGDASSPPSNFGLSLLAGSGSFGIVATRINSGYLRMGVGSADQTQMTLYGRSNATFPSGLIFSTDTPGVDANPYGITFNSSNGNSGNSAGNRNGGHIRMQPGATPTPGALDDDGTLYLATDQGTVEIGVDGDSVIVHTLPANTAVIGTDADKNLVGNSISDINYWTDDLDGTYSIDGQIDVNTTNAYLGLNSTGGDAGLDFSQGAGHTGQIRLDGLNMYFENVGGFYYLDAPSVQNSLWLEDNLLGSNARATLNSGALQLRDNTDLKVQITRSGSSYIGIAGGTSRFGMNTNSPDATIDIQSASTSIPGLNIAARSGQTADLVSIEDDADKQTAGIDQDGLIHTYGRMKADTVVFVGTVNTNQTITLSGTYPVYSIDVAVAMNIEGLSGLNDGEEVTLINEGVANATLTEDDANASAGNRFYPGVNYVLQPGRAVKIRKEDINGGYYFIYN